MERNQPAANNPVLKRKRPRKSEQTRMENSLGLLTKKFVTLIHSARDKCLNLKEAVKLLKVQKRRLYDILNVLEGIGLLKKKHKNIIQWVGDPTAEERSNSFCTNELNNLLEEESNLLKWTKHIQERLEKINSEKDYQKYAYLTYNDVLNLPVTPENQTLMIIQAPTGSKLEFSSSSNEEKKHHTYLKAPTDKVSVLFVSREDTEDNELT